MIVFSFILFIVIFARAVYVLENGLARTPPMGWMSWGYYMCSVDCDKYPTKCLNEKLILSVADTFYQFGYQEAGYEYIIIDDCWAEMERDRNGKLVADRKRFPNGMRYIADYIHSKGLKFGMYTNIAAVTCMRYPGSLHHFYVDTKTFAEWGVDYIKVDGCFVGEDALNTDYIKLGSYLNMTGRPMVYSCSWPYYIQYIHGKQPDFGVISQHCSMWRNYHDIFNSWASVKRVIGYFEEEYPTIHKYHGPGRWNDPDMLILGRDSLTPGQSRIIMSVYSMLSAPLLLSCDMGNIKEFEKKLLLNLDLIAVAQDPLGIMAKPHNLDEVTLWVKPHLPYKGDIFPSYSFLLVNLQEKKSVSFTPSDYGLNCTDGYAVLDVFSGEFLQNITLNEYIFTKLDEDDCIMYTLYPL